MSYFARARELELAYDRKAVDDNKNVHRQAFVQPKPCLAPTSFIDVGRGDVNDM